MRVLVTGAAGSIGRVVTLGLLDRGHEVVGLDLVPAPEGVTGPWHTIDCADVDAVEAYGVGKVAAETLLRLYVDRYALDAVACRIGSCLDEPRTTRALSTWLSHDDCVRMVEAAREADAAEAAYVGGPFVGEELHRPALDLR